VMKSKVKKTMDKKIAVLGAGSWGTAMAIHLGRIGHKVHLWARNKSLIETILRDRMNDAYIPKILFPSNVNPVDSLKDALSDADCVVVAVPSHGLRSVVQQAAEFLAPRTTIVSTTKGLEPKTMLRMSEVIEQEVNPSNGIAVLSGPSFALEVAQELPTAVLVASSRSDMRDFIQQQFRSRYFRLYGSDDVIGVEIGGALKNTIAIAAGVVEGLGLGQNALAGLITRGLVEVSRLAYALGARRETLSGLSGLGDLVLTCTGKLSRNRRVGFELGKGKSLDEIVAGMSMVAEGVRTTDAGLALGACHGVELPITSQMSEVLAGRIEPRAAVEALMLRRQRIESEPD
jgi:glycerol-3-phosphate dehydrogenase (NAD(P)+)